MNTGTLRIEVELESELINLEIANIAAGNLLSINMVAD